MVPKHGFLLDLGSISNFRRISVDLLKSQRFFDQRFLLQGCNSTQRSIDLNTSTIILHQSLWSSGEADQKTWNKHLFIYILTCRVYFFNVWTGFSCFYAQIFYRSPWLEHKNTQNYVSQMQIQLPCSASPSPSLSFGLCTHKTSAL